MTYGLGIALACASQTVRCLAYLHLVSSTSTGTFANPLVPWFAHGSGFPLTRFPRGSRHATTHRRQDPGREVQREELPGSGLRPPRFFLQVNRASKSFKIQADLYTGERPRRRLVRTVRRTLGRVGGMTLDDARAQTMTLLADIKRGIDPNAPSQYAEAWTVARPWDEYEADKTKRELSPRSTEGFRYMLTKYLADWAEPQSAFLAGYEGVLQVDGYKAYNQALSQPGVIGVGCWAHGRRRFVEAQKVSARKARPMIEAIAKLCAIERAAREAALPPDARAAMRKREAKPVLDEIHSKLRDLVEDVRPSSPLGVRCFTRSSIG